MPAATPIRESVLEIDDTSWIIGDLFLLTRQVDVPVSVLSSWSDGDGGFYALSDLADQKTTRALSPSGTIELVHDAGDSNAAWRIGEAFLKVQLVTIPTRTREHTTLNHIHTMDGMTLKVSTPRVLYHRESNGRYYLFTSRVPGMTLEKAWPSMNETTKNECVRQIVDTCKILAKYQNDKICGIDGADLSEGWLLPPRHKAEYSHARLFASCCELGMSCDTFVLYHCDMGPSNVLVDFVDSDGCRVGIIDWECFGFVPIEWIRTKFQSRNLSDILVIASFNDISSRTAGAGVGTASPKTVQKRPFVGRQPRSGASRAFDFEVRTSASCIRTTTNLIRLNLI